MSLSQTDKEIIMSYVHTVPVTAKKFTEQDLEITNLYINTLVYPGLYSKEELPEGFSFIDRRLMDIDAIELDVDGEFSKIDTKGIGNKHQITQSAAIRAAGRGDQADKVVASIREVGYELCYVPISVARCPNNKDMILDGRTRLDALKALGFTNVIVDYYSCTKWDSYRLEGTRRNPIAETRSPMKIEDIINNCNVAIETGNMRRDIDQVTERINKITGRKLPNNTLQKILLNILFGQGHTASVLSLSDESATAWLKSFGYNDNENNNGIYYKVVSASAWSKAITASAKELINSLEENGKKVKEFRLVLHTGTLKAANPEQSWKDAIDSFRRGWREDMSNIERAFFQDYTKRPTIKLYGAIPAVSSLSESYPMDKLVMFHVGKLKDKTFNEIAMDEKMDELFFNVE